MCVYLDNCCFNRPYDDQTNKVIYLEAEAKLFIQEMIKDGKIELVWSYMLEFENTANPHIERRTSIESWKHLAAITIIGNDSLIKQAQEIYKHNFGIKDALHIACAIKAKADYLITTDKGILRKRHLLPMIQLISPIEFITIIQEQL
ncbi:MAG: PIN domain-containing protein [Ignavibacteriae bacterium]|nr:PIN domain-containing protein [Ignavibacteriota bacterium]